MEFYKHIVVKDFRNNDKNIVFCANYFKSVMYKCNILVISCAICHEDDTFNLETGKKIAYNKTLQINKRDVIITTNRSGVLTEEIIQSILEKHADYIKNDLGFVIDGYNQAKKRFEEKNKIKEKYYNLSSDEQALTKTLSEMSKSKLDEFIKIGKTIFK